MMTVTSADVVAAARRQLGARWMHQARLPGVAMDCVGLVIVVARQLGLVAPDFDVGPYGRQPDGSMLTLAGQHMRPLSSIELGAVLAVAVDRDPQHMGIVGDYRHGGWSIIHAHSMSSPPRVVETRLMWSAVMRLRGLYRLPGVVVS